MNQQLTTALSFALDKLSPPNGYTLKSSKTVTQDETTVYIFRYEKSNGNNNGLGGEHYSFTISEAPHRIIGLMWSDSQFIPNQPLLNDDDTANFAKSFINHVEPGMLEKAEYRWTRPESFPITINDKENSITGMRYKLYLPETGKWAWVIVAHNGQIMTFEQNMIWRGGRISEMWLHDNWLLKDTQNHRVKNFVKRVLRKL